MQKAAQDQFYPECVRLEASRGPITWQYADSKGLPTTGIGNLLGTHAALSQATLEMPWRFAGRMWATQAQKQAEWVRLRDAGIKGDGYAYLSAAELFLDEDDIQRLFKAKAASMESNVAGFLPNWASLRADAQLATMSLVWNVGENVLNPKSGAYWQSLTTALKAADYLGASDHCLINATTSERNRRNRRYYLQAKYADVFKAYKIGPDQLLGPDVTVVASMIVNGNPKIPGSHAWWAQVLLREAKTYTATLDGLFGPMSQAAWKKATGETTPTLKGLTKLCTASQYALGIEAKG